MSNSPDAMTKRKAYIKERVDRMCYFYWDFNQDMQIRQHFNRHFKEERERERQGYLRNMCLAEGTASAKALGKKCASEAQGPE